MISVLKEYSEGQIIIKFTNNLKIGLSAEEVKQLENAKLPERENHARNLFLISFYFAGMRVSDVLRLKWSDFQNDRLYYAMDKKPGQKHHLLPFCDFYPQEIRDDCGQVLKRGYRVPLLNGCR